MSCTEAIRRLLILILLNTLADEGSSESGGDDGKQTYSRHVGKSRVIGGEAVEARDYSYFVSLGPLLPPSQAQAQLLGVCGASLVTRRHLISAAHCFSDQKRGDMYVATLALRDACREDFLSQRRISKIRIHPAFQGELMTHDIAILSLARPARRLSPIALPTGPPVGRMAFVLGYGDLSPDQESGYRPCRLQRADLKLFSRQECLSTRIGRLIEDNTGVICAGWLHGGIDSCQGDSGGPLVQTDSGGNDVLIGIVSFGMGCARPGFLGVYTDVYKFRPWIEANIGDAEEETYWG